MSWKQLAGSALLFASALAVSGAVGEQLVRHVRPQQLILRRRDIWQPDSVLGWTHVPNAASTVNTGERLVEWRTDALGLRTGTNGHVDGAYNVVMLGDSFVEAMQVSAEQSVSGLLQRQLSIALRSPVLVHNAGVGGWAPDQYLLRARQLLAAQRIDLLVVSIFLGNDAIDFERRVVPSRDPALVHTLRLPRSMSGPDVVDAVLYPINDFLEVRSHLYMLGRNRMQELRMRLGLSAQQRIVALERSESTSARWSNTAAICDEISVIANAAQVPTVFVLLPAPQQVDPQTLKRYVRGFAISEDILDVDQPNRRLREEMRSRQLDVIDVLGPFREATRRNTSLYGKVDPHLSIAGHELLANSLEAVLRDRLSR